MRQEGHNAATASDESSPKGRYVSKEAFRTPSGRQLGRCMLCCVADPDWPLSCKKLVVRGRLLLKLLRKLVGRVGRNEREHYQIGTGP